MFQVTDKVEFRQKMQLDVQISPPVCVCNPIFQDASSPFLGKLSKIGSPSQVSIFTTIGASVCNCQKSPLEALVKLDFI